MNETRETKVPEPKIKNKEVLEKLFQSREKKAPKVSYSSRTLETSNKYLHDLAQQLSSEADQEEKRVHGDKKKAEATRQQAIEVMMLVTGGEETVGKGKFRETLLLEAKQRLINELPDALQGSVEDFNDRDKDVRKDARKEFHDSFGSLSEEEKAKARPVVDQLRELNKTVYEVSTRVASAEGRKGEMSWKEEIKARGRGELVAPESIKNRFGRWFFQKIGKDRDVWADPGKLTTVQKELEENGGNAFDIYRESVKGDMDALVEGMKGEKRVAMEAQLKQEEKKKKREEVTEPAAEQPHELKPEEQAAVDAANKKLEEEKDGKKEGYNIADKYKTRFTDIINAGGTPEEQAAKMKAVLKEVAGEFSADPAVGKVIEDVIGKGFEEGQTKLTPEQRKKVSEWRWLLLYIFMTLPEAIISASAQAAKEAVQGAVGGN